MKTLEVEMEDRLPNSSEVQGGFKEKAESEYQEEIEASGERWLESAPKACGEGEEGEDGKTQARVQLFSLQ